MKKKIVIFAMLMAMTLFWMPAGGNTVSAQKGQDKARKSGNYGINVYQGQRRNRQRDWNRGKKKSANGYKNYGQYRRTQVGNRRYRLVRRSYWRDGNRLTRLVRVYY